MAPQSSRLGGAIFIAILAIFCYISQATQYARIAQLVEHITDTDRVLGSNPSARTQSEELLRRLSFSRRGRLLLFI